MHAFGLEADGYRTFRKDLRLDFWVGRFVNLLPFYHWNTTGHKLTIVLLTQQLNKTRRIRSPKLLIHFHNYNPISLMDYHKWKLRLKARHINKQVLPLHYLLSDLYLKPILLLFL